MKRILIVSHWMEIGGAERSLLGLLDSFDYDKYSVDLFLCRHSGEFMQYIPNSVNILPEDNKARDIATPIRDVLKHRNYDVALGRTISKIASKVYNFTHKFDGISTVEIEYSNKFTYRFVEDINNNIEYDLAISFLEPHYIVANKVNAKTKIAWIHTDYAAINIDIKEGYNVWNKYDKIVSISEECSKSFMMKYPKLEKKIILIENIISESLILKQAELEIKNNEITKSEDEVILLSIGRFCEAKNFENIPNIAKKLISKNIKVKWYIIGFGGYEQIIKDKIKKEGMENNVIILGKKENPYPYLKLCDIYVQPSKYEGKSIAVREAQILNKPVVITKFPTSQSQLENGIDGIICPMDNDGCADSIENLIKDKKLQEHLISNTKIKNYINSHEIKKIYNLIK